MEEAALCDWLALVQDLQRLINQMDDYALSRQWPARAKHKQAQIRAVANQMKGWGYRHLGAAQLAALLEGLDDDE